MSDGYQQKQARGREAERLLGEPTCRAIFDSSPHGFLVTDRTGRIVEANAALCRALGYARTELLDLSLSQLAVDTEAVAGHLEAVLEGSRAIWRVAVGRKDGTPLELEIEAGHVPDLETIMAVVRFAESDVGDTDGSLRALRDTERRYRDLYEGMRDGAAAVSTDGTIIECNVAFEAITGYSRAELAKLTYRDITPDKWHRMEDEIITTQVLTRGYSDLYEKEYRRKDGAVIPVQLRSYRVATGDGGSPSMWAVVRDVSEMHDTQRRLKETKEALEHEQASLHNKNIALQELIRQVDAEKQRLGDTMQRNVSRLVEPVLATLAGHIDETGREQLKVLHDRLAKLVSPFVRSLELRHPSLTPRQTQICDLIRSGLPSKEIASALNISPQTVLTLRKTIRRKLGLTHDKVNLAAYLRSLDPPSAARG